MPITKIPSGPYELFWCAVLAVKSKKKKECPGKLVQKVT